LELHIACFFWISSVWILTPVITVIIGMLYPWLWISLKFDKISFCLIKCLFKGFGNAQEEVLKERSTCCCLENKKEYENSEYFNNDLDEEKRKKI